MQNERSVLSQTPSTLCNGNYHIKEEGKNAEINKYKSLSNFSGPCLNAPTCLEADERVSLDSTCLRRKKAGERTALPFV